MDEHLGFLSSLSFLPYLDNDYLTQIYSKSFLITRKRGQIVYSKGDRADKFYIVKSGFLELRAKSRSPDNKDISEDFGKGKEKVLMLLPPKSCFGETELLEKTTRKYNIVCQSAECQLYEFCKSTFIFLISNNPAILASISLHSKESTQFLDSISLDSPKLPEIRTKRSLSHEVVNIAKRKNALVSYSHAIDSGASNSKPNLLSLNKRSISLRRNNYLRKVSNSSENSKDSREIQAYSFSDSKEIAKKALKNAQNELFEQQKEELNRAVYDKMFFNFISHIHVQPKSKTEIPSPRKRKSKTKFSNLSLFKNIPRNDSLRFMAPPENGQINVSSIGIGERIPHLRSLKKLDSRYLINKVQSKELENSSDNLLSSTNMTSAIPSMKNIDKISNLNDRTLNKKVKIFNRLSSSSNELKTMKIMGSNSSFQKFSRSEGKFKTEQVASSAFSFEEIDEIVEVPSKSNVKC